ncbi:alpha/beta hydrolase [Frateuria aurantia]|uniref:alpha/beta hydrolase n=1 Tax=Frateuria aurantia TaxID=81475 RepID=UPI00024639F8|nr:alpha/beta hydrolase [Frateuria aurantia]
MEKSHEVEAQFLVEYHDYYMTKRGYHPRAVNSGNAWTITTPLSFMNMPILSYIKDDLAATDPLRSRRKAHSLYLAQTAYANATEPKELMIIPDAVHIDLYDQLDKIPFDKLTSFFQQHLASA